MDVALRTQAFHAERRRSTLVKLQKVLRDRQEERKHVAATNMAAGGGQIVNFTIRHGQSPCHHPVEDAADDGIEK